MSSPSIQLERISRTLPGLLFDCNLWGDDVFSAEPKHFRTCSTSNRFENTFYYILFSQKSSKTDFDSLIVDEFNGDIG